MLEDREVLAVLSESLAGALFVIGLVVALSAIGPRVELAGKKVSPTKWWSRILAGVVGLGLLAMASWSLFVSHALQITRVEVRSQSESYSRPCPKQASVFVLMTAQGGPGRVTYFIDLAGRPSPMLKADLGGE